MSFNFRQLYWVRKFKLKEEDTSLSSKDKLCIRYYTCPISRSTIVQTPSVTSPTLVSCILLNKFPHASRNSLPLPLIPSRFFSWVEAIVRAAAAIKPAVTGNDMNCTRKPDKKTETHIWMNFNCMLPFYCTLYCTFQAALLELFFFVMKQTRCTNFTNLFWHETLHVSDSSSVHHQEFIHCTLSNGVCHTGL